MLSVLSTQQQHQQNMPVNSAHRTCHLCSSKSGGKLTCEGHLQAVVVVHHRGHAVKAVAIKLELINPPARVGQQEPQGLPVSCNATAVRAEAAGARRAAHCCPYWQREAEPPDGHPQAADYIEVLTAFAVPFGSSGGEI